MFHTTHYNCYMRCDTKNTSAVTSLVEQEQNQEYLQCLQRNYLIIHYIGQWKQKRKPWKSGSHRTLILLRNVCICSLNNFNWSCVFYRLRDTHSSVTKAYPLWSSITEAHLWEEKIIPTHYQGRYSNFCNLVSSCFVPRPDRTKTFWMADGIR